MTDGRFRAGDVVEVRSFPEILATLDERGALAALPFMPEMLQHCGKRFVVDKRAEKICDTVKTGHSRRVPDTVMLADLRCDGAAHAGCQAECRLFWKEAWLRGVRTGESDPAHGRAGVAASKDHERLAAHVKHLVEVDGRPVEVYRCQATELYDASHHLGTFDPRPYVREYTSGNVSLGRFLRVTARAAVEEPLRVLGLLPRVFVKGKGPRAPQEPSLDLQPGEWVQVKTRAEIAETLTEKGRHRGLWFDREMLPHCGRVYRVRRRITRIIDDRNGRLIEMKNDCVTLEGAVCSGELSSRRWFCPRAIYPYWRECWLRRVPAGGRAA